MFWITGTNGVSKLYQCLAQTCSKELPDSGKERNQAYEICLEAVVCVIKLELSSYRIASLDRFSPKIRNG